MKKLIVLCVFLSFSLFADAQIKRNFDGLVLGKTSREEVVSNLRSKSLFPKDADGGKAIRAVGKIAFAGVVWDVVKYFFINDKLYKILYIKYYDDRPVDYINLDEAYLKIRNGLLKKYTNQKSPSSGVKVPNNLFLKSKDTTVEIEKRCEQRNYLRLRYTDINLNRQSKQKDYDEL